MLVGGVVVDGEDCRYQSDRPFESGAQWAGHRAVFCAYFTLGEPAT